MKKPKKKTLAQLKKEADRVYSIYIRLKGSKDGMNACYTCGKIYAVKELQCGHFISRTHLNTRWDERNTKPQCFSCNVWKRGEGARFAKHLIEEYGHSIIEELDMQRSVIKQMKRADYVELINKYF